MISQTWQQQPISLTSLHDEVERTGSWDYGIFEFLHNIGVVPWGVKSVAASKVLTGLDPDAVPSGYLASAAYEWDSWGPSQPIDFIRALEAELHPEKRDFIAALLTTLGRSIQ